MAEASTVIPDLSLTYAPGTAPVTIKSRYHRWRPRDFHADAVPQSAEPSAAIMTNTVTAINNMGLASVVQEYERGTYYVNGTISPTGGSSDTSLAPKQVYFNDTTIKASAGSNANAFQQCFDQQTGTGTLAGKSLANSNIPEAIATYVLFDVTNTERSSYMGNLTIDCSKGEGAGNKTGLAAIAAANRNAQNGVGGIGSVWAGNLRLVKCYYGLFGTPRYADARNFYAGAFVGNVFNRVRSEANCTYPIFVGGNQMDDCFMGEYNQAGASGAKSIIFGTQLTMGTCYVNGQSDTDYAFDIQRSHLTFGTLFAENNLAAAILQKKLSWVQGTLKWNLSLTGTHMIVNEEADGGGLITGHIINSLNSSTMGGLVHVKVLANSTRNYTVYQPYTSVDTNFKPFSIGGNAGQANIGSDYLVSNSSEGQVKHVVGGTVASPTLTAKNFTIDP